METNSSGGSPRAPRRGSTGRAAAGCALVGLLALLGVFGYRVGGDAGWLGAAGGAVAGAPGVFSTGRLVEPPFARAPVVGLRLYSGGTLDTSQLRAKPFVVTFWASWCPPCREEAPLLEEVSRDYRDDGVTFVGVNIWDREEDARAFLEEYGVTYPNGWSPNGASAVEYGLTGIPETFFIDRRGEVTRKWLGPFDERSLRTYLDEIVAR